MIVFQISSFNLDIPGFWALIIIIYSPGRHTGNNIF